MVIGLDFGTHQTKVCINDDSNPNGHVYSFWKFRTPDGDMYALPSVVSVNQDDTLTYGYVDKDRSKKLVAGSEPEPKKPTIAEPVFAFSEAEPVLSFPPKPERQESDWKDKLRTLLGRKDEATIQWEKECECARHTYDREYRLWKSHYEKAECEYREQLAEYQCVLAEYDKEYAAWESRMRPRAVVFRYFKQATFSNVQWNHFISKDLLSIWYLSYILFDLEARYGQNFSIQMGFPTDASRCNARRAHAYRLLLSAYRLVEDEFENDKDRFLASTYQDLIKKTVIVQPNKENIQSYGLLAIPEACASLMPITNIGKIGYGISLIVDIGGGTTDISLFCLKDNEPQIYGYYSVDVGINYLVEYATAREDVFSRENMLTQISYNSLTRAQRKRANEKFNKSVTAEVDNIVHALQKEFGSIGLSPKRLLDALKNRTIVYSGGGSTSDELCGGIRYFTDIKKISSDIWRGYIIENETEVKPLAHILTTALGLAVPRIDENIPVFPIGDIFKHLAININEEKTQENDYSLQQGCV